MGGKRFFPPISYLCTVKKEKANKSGINYK